MGTPEDPVTDPAWRYLAVIAVVIAIVCLGLFVFAMLLMSTHFGQVE